MKRWIVSAAATALAVGFAAAPAVAQSPSATGDLTVTATVDPSVPSDYDQTGTDVLTNAPLNAAECATGSGAVVHLAISNIPAGTALLDFWTGSDCSAANRSVTTTTSCTHLDIGPTMMPGTSLMDLQFDVPDLCSNPGSAGQLNEGSNSLYVLAGNTSPETGDIGTSWGALQVKVVTTPPDPPSGVTGGSGDTAVPVQWTAPADPSFVDHYAIYVDTTAASCAETTFVGGEPVPAGATLAKTVTSGSSTTIDLSALGVPVGGDAAVAVVSVDRAFNASVLSNTACVMHVATEGFCAKRGGCPTGCTVASAAGQPVGPGAPLGLLALGAVALLIRRRRKR